METEKKAVDLEGLSKGLLDKLDGTSEEIRLDAVGVGGEASLEPVPEFLKTESECVFQGKNNAWLVFGKDRPGSRASGYGGRGDTQCGMVDIVVGRMGAHPRAVDESGQKIFADPSFKGDAARIYMSQKTDVDKNFGLAVGKVGVSTTKSAIALKADALRFVAREGIKLVTTTDSQNSQGAKVEEVRGIDIIAGNDDEHLEPMVKGDALTKCLERLVYHIDKLTGIVDILLTTQMNLNAVIAHHVHYSPFFGISTTPSPELISNGIKAMIDHAATTKVDLVKEKMNLVMFKNNYLSPTGIDYINSRFNHVN
jgi:hypothetical protein